MAYEMVMPYHLHMPSYFLETFTEYPEECQVSDEKFFSIKLSFIKLSYSTYTFSY